MSVMLDIAAIFDRAGSPPAKPAPGQEERNRRVLTTDVTSFEAAGVLAEVHNSLAEADRQYALARGRALDPVAKPESADVDRKLMERLSFERDRLSVAVTQLNDRVAQLQEQEKAKAYQAALDAAMAERDELAARLRDRYPALVTEMVALFTAIAASDARLATLNRKGEPLLIGAEYVARGFATHATHVPRLWQSRLVKFDPDEAQRGLAWPVPAPVSLSIRHG